MKIPTVWNASESTRRVKRRALSSSRQVRNRCGDAPLASGGANAHHLRLHRSGEADMADVRLTGVRKAFGDTTVLDGVDLTVADGEFVVVVGPSGCGKSTLLRVIAGLEAPGAGSVALGSSAVAHLPPAERGIARVFQSYALYPQARTSAVRGK